MPASGLRVEWRPLAGLASLRPDWLDLCARAAEPNVFYEPAFALPAAAALGADTGAGLAWADGRLVGLFPAGVQRHRWGLRLPVLVGWTHDFAPLGTPLVDRDHAAEAIAAWLDFVARAPDLPSLWLLPLLPDGGPVAAALDTVLGARRQAAFGRHHRALLAPADDGRADYWERTVSAGRRKELRRQRRRLSEAGTLRLDQSNGEAAALDDFLALEAAGWKGRRSTAAASDPRIRAFMTDAVIGLAREGKAAVHTLLLDGRPVAAGIVLRSGRSGWFWKTAYDESLARLSPGVLLAADVTAALLADPALARADSCAIADHPMIDRIWGERLSLADRLVAADPKAAFGFALAARLEDLRRAGVATARDLRDLRDRLRGPRPHAA